MSSHYFLSNSSKVLCVPVIFTLQFGRNKETKTLLPFFNPLAILSFFFHLKLNSLQNRIQKRELRTFTVHNRWCCFIVYYWTIRVCYSHDQKSDDTPLYLAILATNKYSK